MFVGLHVMLADATDTPEIALTEDEGNSFMKSAQRVLRHYSVQTTQKTLDWLAFVGTITPMYGTRLTAIALRKRKEKSESEGDPNVIRFRSKPASGGIHSTNPDDFIGGAAE